MSLHAQFLHHAHFNVELKNPEAQAFMDQIQLRADKWVRSGNAQVFNYRGNYLSDAERLSLDPLNLESSGTWQLSLLRSGGYDTLALVGFAKSFKNSRILFWSTNGSITEPIDAPRYILPLNDYHDFLSEAELGRVTSIAENEMLSIATSQYNSGSHSVSTFSWSWNSPHDRPLFSPYLAGMSARRWSLEWGGDVYATPDTQSTILPSTAKTIIESRDTTFTLNSGDTTYVHTTGGKKTSALEFAFHLEPLEWLHDDYGWNRYRTYSTTCHWIGLTFEGDTQFDLDDGRRLGQSEQHPHTQGLV